MGGLIGSIIILLSITPINTYSGHLFIKLLFSVLMILATFGYKRFRYFFSGLMTFYLTTFLIGGALIGIHYFLIFDFELSSSVFLASIKGFGDPISWLFVLLGFPLAWYFSKRNMEGIEMTKIQYESLIKVMIEIGGIEYSFKGLVDSGNQVYEPITRTPVMFISLKDRVSEFPRHLIEIAENPEEFIFGKKDLPNSWELKFRIIPYKVVGQEHQLIIAILPNKILLEKATEIIEVERGLVSFTMQQLSGDDAFQCIVHPKMLTSTRKATIPIDGKHSFKEGGY